MADIKDLRNEIDNIDAQIKKLFIQRMDVCKGVGEYKLENGLPVLDSNREEQLLENKTADLSGDSKDEVSRLFRCIMDISKDKQRSLMEKRASVAYCGTKGAYGYFAAKSVSKSEPVSYPSFMSVISAVEKREAAYGVLPIENTTSGSVLEVYDLLGASSVFIAGETVIPVHHCLLGLGGKDDVKSVISHPQALFQCSKFLNSHSFTISQSVNTAIAAKNCSEKGEVSTGVIASRECGELYGLHVLWESIEDTVGNKTRFLIISSQPDIAVGANKASLTFTLPHREGSLLEMLNYFKGVNLTKIESRPVGDFEYRFYLDFISDTPNKIIQAINQNYNTVKVLGVYNSYNQ